MPAAALGGAAECRTPLLGLRPTPRRCGNVEFMPELVVRHDPKPTVVGLDAVRFHHAALLPQRRAQPALSRI